MLDKTATMAKLTPLFAVHGWDLDDEPLKDMVFAEIDDCDCEECDGDRGGVMPFTTLRLGVSKGGKTLVARLTPEEAKDIALEMLSYCEMMSELSEGEELDEHERFTETNA